MKRILFFAVVIGFTVMSQGCAVYAPPYGYSTGYYGYTPYYGLGLNYSPRVYYGYRPYGHFGVGPGYYGWGGRWGGWYGGRRNWGGRGRWHGRW